MITRRSVSISLGAALGALAVRTGRAQPQPSVEEITRLPVVYSVPGMADVRVRDGLVYKTCRTRPCTSIGTRRPRLPPPPLPSF